MKHLHRNVIIAGLFGAALVGGAYALLGIGFAAIVAVGLFVVGGIRLPWWQDAHDPDRDHGYHPAP